MTRTAPTVSRVIKATAPVVLTAMLIVSCGDDPDSSGKPPVLRVGQQASPNGAAMGEAASDSKMMPFRPVEWKFEVNGDLPALDDEMSAWVFRRGAEPSASQLEKLAKAFSVDGEFAKNVSDPGTEYEWKTWMAGPNDGSGPSITVSSDAMLSWWFSEGWAAVSTPTVSCPEPVPSVGGSSGGGIDANGETGEATDSAVVAPCTTEEMTPPENVPSKSEAEDLFLSLAADLGWSEKDLILETWADEWSAGVTGYVKIDGVRSSLIINASFGENGRVTYAGGFLAEPEKLADYPQIGTSAALDRLREQYSGSWGPYRMGEGMPVDDVAVAEPGSVSEGESDVVVSTEPPVVESTTTVPTTEPTDDTTTPTEAPIDSTVDTVPVDDTTPAETTVVDDTVPVEDTLPVETITVTIEAVEQEYVFLWGVDGETYLVPGYAFIAAEDEWGYVPRYIVASIPDEFMDEVAPDMMPPVAEPMPSEEVPIEGTPSGESPSGEVTQEMADSLVGMSEADATKTAEGNGWQVRIAARDGETFPLTMDYRADRVNLTIVDGAVTEVLIG